ncbi:MAG: hypothetical protein ACI9S8_003108 [Chlamydiales bacterium]|jgi:hypothetical protein
MTAKTYDENALIRFKMTDQFISSRYFLNKSLLTSVMLRQGDEYGWEFIIKLYGLLETLIVESFILYTRKEEQRSLFASIPLLRESRAKNTQIDLLMKAGILDTEDEKLIRLIIDMKNKFSSRLALVHQDFDYFFLLDENRSGRRAQIVDTLMLRKKRTKFFFETAFKERSKVDNRKILNGGEIMATYDVKRSIDDTAKFHLEKLIDSNPKVAVMDAFECLAFNLSL